LHYADVTERRTWFHAAHARRSRVLAGGSTAAVAIVVLAALVGPLLPGARSDAWFDYRSIGDGEGGGLISPEAPIVRIRAKLLEDPEREVFTVTSNSDPMRTPYWRLIALDRYTGDAWTLHDTSKPADEMTRTRDRPRRTELVNQQFSIIASDPYFLPAAYRPVEINLGRAQVIIDSSTLLLDRSGELQDVEYEVTSEVPTPSEAELDETESVNRAEVARYLELPDDFPDRIRNTALEIVTDAGAETPYAQATALQNWLNRDGGFVYDLNVAQSHSINTLEDFLYGDPADGGRRGYCEQFASAFAAMARSLGLPTRIAVGFTPGELDGSGVYHVKNKDAHAWPEVFFGGLGWLPLEPTPNRFERTLGNGTGAPPTAPGETETTIAGSTTTTLAGGATPSSTPFPRADQNVDITAPGAARDSGSPAGRVFVGISIAIAVVVLLLVLAVGALAAVAWRRTRHRRTAADPRDRVLGAWAQALDWLAEAGIDRKPSATPVEFALRYAPAHGAGGAGPPLMELAQLHTAALFAADPPAPETADEAWVHADKIDNELWHMVSPTVRWRRRLDPRRARLLVD
jgi:transglutaminase-like putative cysteine protease